MPNEQKHTSGLIAANAGSGRIYNTWGIYKDGTRLATLFDIGSPETQHADAELWAAAPKMALELASLKADKARLLEALEACEIAMMQARLDIAKMDERLGATSSQNKLGVFPCNQIVVRATQAALDAARAAISATKEGV